MSLIDRRVLMLSAAAAAAASPVAGVPLPMKRCCPIVELRQYTLRRDQRDVLIDLFDAQLIEPQEAVGARVIGQFRDLDDPDRFVWLRGFESLETRAVALGAFYGGPVWAAHRQAANATMVDSDNVLLLHPAQAGQGFALPPNRSGAAGVGTATIRYVPPDLADMFAAFFEAQMRPHIEAAGARVLATFASETSPNTFPRLPIRSGDHVHIWFARFETAQAQQTFAERLAAVRGWRDQAPDALLPALMRKPEVLRLAPTSRSLLR